MSPAGLPYDDAVSAFPAAAGLVLSCGVVAAALFSWLVRRTAEPELEPDEAKVPYATLATWRHVAAVGLWAAGLAAVAVVAVEPARIGPWLVVAVVGALASVVDLATTWIPRRWLHGGWGLAVLSVLVSAAATDDWAGIWRSALGVLIVGGAYGLVYVLSLLIPRGFFGFADVRLGILVGMAAGWRSVQTATSALVLGALVGALWGLVHLVSRRRDPYPYGPAIVLGPYLALAVGLATGQ